MEQGNDDAGRAEDDQRLLVERGIERNGFHRRSVAAAEDLTIILPQVAGFPGVTAKSGGR